MESSFCCPKCKEPLTQRLLSYHCEKCQSCYEIKDGYVDFITGDFYAGEIPRSEFRELLSNIDHSGFNGSFGKIFRKISTLTPIYFGC